MLLVRHGQSEWNAVGRWQGQADPALTDLGREQAWQAARRVGSVDVIVSSDLQRAMETAQIISGQIGVGPVVVEPLLRERDAGEWSGLTQAEIEAQWPGHLEAGKRPASVETDEVLTARVTRALAMIQCEFDGADVLVLTHGGVIGAIEAGFGLPFVRIANLEGRHLVHHGDRLALGDRVPLLGNDDLLTTVPAQI